MVLRLTVTTTGDSVATYEFTFDAAEVTIGRSATCTVQLPFPTVSGHHLTLLREGDSYLVADVGSTNGTTLNGRPITRDHYVPLHDGDRLVLTDISLRVSFGRDHSIDRTGEETGELVRRMAMQYLDVHSPADDNAAYVEVLQGPDYGARLPLPGGPFTLCPGVGRPPEGANAWPLADAQLTAGTFAVTFDGFVHAVRPDKDSATPTWVDGYAIDPGTTVRLRSGSRIHCGSTTLLFVDPLAAYLEKLEPAAPEREHKRPTTAPQRPITADLLDDDPETHEPGFEPSETRRVTGANAPHGIPPRTTAGLPLRDVHEPALAAVARADALADELNQPSSSFGRTWSGIDIALLILAVVLGSSAVIVFLVLFEVI